MKFRELRADEIDCRVATVSDKGCSLLLYKDARCDQNILDETVGAMNWQRKHSRDNANCEVGIWDEKKKQWVWKEDTGTESYTEKEKGLASDSFKRACFNWGIGRELYTAPFIWINAGDAKIESKNGKFTTYDKFAVTDIGYTDGKISRLTIYNTKRKQAVYSFVANRAAAPKEEPKQTISEPSVEKLRRICSTHKIPESVLAAKYNHTSLAEFTKEDWDNFSETGKAFLDEWDGKNES